MPSFGAISETITNILGVISKGQATKSNSLPVAIASDQDPLAVTAASLPLPAGAATAAKQPALGTAGTASTDVISVQGIAGGVAQPISAVTLPLPTGAALDATLTGGTQKAIARGGQKGATATNADITHTAEGADHEALDVQIMHGGTAKDPTAIRALTSADVVSLGAGSAVVGHVINDASSAVIGHVIADTGSTTAVTGNVATTNAAASQADGHSSTFGATTDAAVTTDVTGSISARLRGLVNLIAARLPAALGAGGGLKVDGSGTALPVSGTVTAGQGTAAAGSGAWPVKVTDTADALVRPGDAANNAIRVNVVAGGASGGTSSSFGAAFPATGTAVGASDGTNLKALAVDASGNLKVNVAAGGASGGTSSGLGSADPATGTAAGFSDGTNLREARVFDADSGAGTQFVLGALLKKPASGGSVDFGTSSDPVRTDPTGTTTQPVSGTVTANIGTSGSLALDATLATTNTELGGLTETAPATDTASSGLNGRLQRIAQRLTSLIALLPAALVGGRLDVNLGAAPAVVTDKNDQTAASTAAWTNATALNTALTLTVTNYGTVVVEFWESDSGSAVLATGVLIFEVDGGSAQWFPISGVRAGSYTAETSYTVTGGKQLWQFDVAAGTSFRVRLNPVLTQGAGTGTATANLRVQAVASAAEPTVVVGQPTATNLNATVVQATGSNLHAVLDAGAAVIGALSANQSANVAQVAGTATDTNSGVKSAGTQRVVLATDQPALTNALKVDGSAVTQPVSAAALPLPSGASTSAKQPALGTAGSASADVISVQGVASMTALKTDGSGVTQPVSAASLPLPTGAAADATLTGGTAKARITDGTNTAAVKAASTAAAATDPAAVVSLSPNSPIPTGTNSVGNVGLAPRTSGGLSISRTLSAANTTGINAKASAGQVYGWYISNTNAAARFVKLYNKASAPTVGTDTPVMTVVVPAGGATNIEFTNGIAFGTGIGYGITAAVGDADTTAPAANEVVVNLLFA